MGIYTFWQRRTLNTRIEELRLDKEKVPCQGIQYIGRHKNRNLFKCTECDDIKQCDRIKNSNRAIEKAILKIELLIGNLN